MEKAGHPDTTWSIGCYGCGGTGKLDEMQQIVAKFEKEMWCCCQREGRTSPIYHENGEMPWKWCVRKHHYHCPYCEKILQIG